MTTMFEEDVKCCVCGETSSHRGISSTNSFGSPDLDTRPPEMERSTISYWIQRCPSCGYCSPDLSKCDVDIKEIVESKEYQDIISDIAMPEVARSFLALSYQKQQLNQYSDAAWRAIHAAWICDDENNYEASTKCRETAISMIVKGKANSQKIGDQEGASEAITIDLMRRAGMFQQANELIESIKTNNIDEVITRVINYQATLVALKDIDSHTVSEALEDRQVRNNIND